MGKINLFNKDTECIFINTTFLLNEIWNTVFESSVFSLRVNLSRYFILDEEKFIKFSPKFFELSEEKQNKFFVVLVEFLGKYHLKHNLLLIEVPKHPNENFDEQYHPLEIYYEKPVPMGLNLDTLTFIIIFNKENSEDLCKYRFGHKIRGSSEMYVFDFPFNCFKGMQLV